MADEKLIQSLRQALAQSPDNAPIRRMLADALLEAGQALEAEQDYRAAVAL